MDLLSYEEAANMSEAEVLEWIARYEQFKHRQERRAWLLGTLSALGFCALVVAATLIVSAAKGWI